MATTTAATPGMSSATRVTEAVEAPGSLVQPIRWRIARLAERSQESHATATLALEVADWPRHRAGQHVDVRLTAEDGYRAQRSYSIASAPEDGRLTITVERLDDGEVSPYLVDVMEPGDDMEVRGPIGGWFVWRAADGGPLLLIAGGSGLVPLMSMLRHRATAAPTVPCRLLLSARNEADALYSDEIAELAGVDQGLTAFTTLTRSAPADWPGYERRVDREMLAEVSWPPEEAPLIYICGPTGFVEAVAGLLTELGHDPTSIKTERFGPTPEGSE